MRSISIRPVLSILLFVALLLLPFQVQAGGKWNLFRSQPCDGASCSPAAPAASYTLGGSVARMYVQPVYASTQFQSVTRATPKRFRQTVKVQTYYQAAPAACRTQACRTGQTTPGACLDGTCVPPGATPQAPAPAPAPAPQPAPAASVQPEPTVQFASYTTTAPATEAAETQAVTPAAAEATAAPATAQAYYGDPYGFTAWLNSVRAQYALGAVGYDANLTNWASVNNSHQNAYGMGHHVMGPARRQNSGMGASSTVFAMWMGSPAHRAALLDPSISWIGIAASGAYWTFNAY